MKILIYGAGVIGSIYAAKLFEAKNDVTLLARGKNYESLQQNGIIINDRLTGKEISIHVPLIQHLEKNDFYDLVIVAVRLDQIESVIPDLKNNIACPLVMFMLNNPENISTITESLHPKHIILGFPGAGGIRNGDTINFIRIKQQKTTIGEINGEKTARIKNIKALLENTGFEVSINNNMQAWLKTHAVFIACISAAIIKENGDSTQLGKNKSTIRLMVKSIEEGFKALKALGITITPFNLKLIFMIMPKWFSVSYWQKAMQSNMGTLAMAPHANAAKSEMQLLAKKVLKIVHSSSVATPNLDKILLKFISTD